MGLPGVGVGHVSDGVATVFRKLEEGEGVEEAEVQLVVDSVD